MNNDRYITINTYDRDAEYAKLTPEQREVYDERVNQRMKTTLIGLAIFIPIIAGFMYFMISKSQKDLETTNTNQPKFIYSTDQKSSKTQQ